jgi:hypothetical protein
MTFGQRRKITVKRTPTGILRAALLTCGIAFAPTGLLADMVSGADDPAFLAAMATALSSDDISALQDLHVLAVAGNQAALVALPTVERWTPRTTGSLRDRVAMRKIGGVPVTDLAAGVSTTAQVWQQGNASADMAEQLDRATALYAVGETAKGDALLGTWMNQTGGVPPLPDGFADLPAAAWLKAAIIEARLNPFYGNPDYDPAGSMAILNAWLADDRIEGWIVLARVTGLTGREMSPDDTAHGQSVRTAALAALPAAIAVNADARMATGALVWSAFMAQQNASARSAAEVDAIWADLAPRAEFAPLRAYCAARCPGEPKACERAYIQAFGYRGIAFAWYEPQFDVISAATFYASPRGERLLFTEGLATAQNLPRDAHGDVTAINAIPAIAAARGVDACFATGLDRVLEGPLPDGG